MPNLRLWIFDNRNKKSEIVDTGVPCTVDEMGNVNFESEQFDAYFHKRWPGSTVGEDGVCELPNGDVYHTDIFDEYGNNLNVPRFQFNSNPEPRCLYTTAAEVGLTPNDDRIVADEWPKVIIVVFPIATRVSFRFVGVGRGSDCEIYGAFYRSDDVGKDMFVRL